MSFPQAAHMSVTPPFIHLCSGQHSSRSPGRHPTQIRGRAGEGESLSCSRNKREGRGNGYILGFCLFMHADAPQWRLWSVQL